MHNGLVRFEGVEELRTDWVGSRNFFDKSSDSCIMQLSVSTLKGMRFVWAAKRAEKGKKCDPAFAKPEELVLMSNDGYRQVSFKDLV